MNGRSARALKAIALGALALCTLTVLVSAVGEQLQRHRVRARYPLRGRLVAVDGARRLQLDCRGSGRPIVVLESGLDNYGSLSWSTIHDSLASTTRVCAYSRAGIMWSDRAPMPFDSRRAMRDLHRALDVAGESGPLVIVAHSLGAAYALRFTADYPNDVAGLVLVDPSHPDQFDAYRQATGKSLEPPMGTMRVGARLAWTGVVRLVDPSGPSSLPTSVLRATAAYLPTSLAALSAEGLAAPGSLRDVRGLRDLGDRPLVVLGSTEPTPKLALTTFGLTQEQGEQVQRTQRLLREDLARFSRRGRHVIVPKSGHYIHLDQPAVVIDAIRGVVRMLSTTPRAASQDR